MPPFGPTSIGLDQLTEAQVAACGREVRSFAEGARHRQQVAERIVRYFYEGFRSAETGEPSCVLARCFQTSPYASLPLDYQEAADRLLEGVSSDRKMRCLALLATRGDKLTWNDVVTSIAHQAIPLPSVEVVKRAPMIARLLEQFEVPLHQVVSPRPSSDFLLSASKQNFDVFHIPDAVDSPFIPAQESFVAPFGVKSVLGMGGVLPDGEIFAVILFTRIPFSREVAQRFRTLATDVTEALSPFKHNEIYSGYSKTF